MQPTWTRLTGALTGGTAGTAADDWERPAPTARQCRDDLRSGLVLAALTLVSGLLSRSAGTVLGPGRSGIVESALWCLAVSLPLVVRRRFPVTVLILVAAAFIGLQARFVTEQMLSSVNLFLALYTAGAWARERQIARAVQGVVVLVMFAWLAYSLSTVAWAHNDRDQAATDGPLPAHVAAMIWIFGVNVLFFGAALVAGEMAWQRARQDAELAQRNAELAAEREAGTRRAVVAERLRIARELHDVVAHHVSLMGIQAAAARRVLEHDVDLARSTLEGMEDASRQGVDEMQRLLLVLRSDDEVGHKEPTPGVGRLDDLVASAVRAGLPVRLAVVGTPFELSAGVSLSAYRIVQEALTNALRYAAGQRTDVRLRYLDGAVEVEVVDDGPGSTDRRTGSAGGGMGHLGMRERMAVHGGLLEVGPRPEGGYRVRARFPVAARPAPASSASPPASASPASSSASAAVEAGR